MNCLTEFRIVLLKKVSEPQKQMPKLGKQCMDKTRSSTKKQKSSKKKNKIKQILGLQNTMTELKNSKENFKSRIDQAGESVNFPNSSNHKRRAR